MSCKYGFGYYAVAHATKDSGGSVQGRKDPKGLKEVLKSRIEYDVKNFEMKVTNCRNSVKGRY